VTDYASFKIGAVTYPLPMPGSGLGGVGSSLLRDADPPLFYLLEFYARLLEIHIQSRLMAEVAAGNIAQIERAVHETLPLDPERYLLENQFNFPLLAAYRKSSKAAYVTNRIKHYVDDVEVVYVLPAMSAGHAERVLPILKAVYNLFDNRTEMGADPNYTPTSPTLTAGSPFWQAAGLTKAGVTGASYGAYDATEKLFFPCVKINVELVERSDYALTEFEEADRYDVDVDLAHTVDETLEDVAQIQVDVSE
jgi:hypothetical protein